MPEDVHVRLQARADTSVLANAVGDDGTDGDRAREALRGEELSVPDLVDVEVVSVLRRRWLAKTMSARRFAAAVDDLGAVPADRYPVLPVDRRLATAPGPWCAIRVIGT